MAKSGLRFTQSYNSTRCWPSRAALLSGYYPQQILRDKLPGVAGSVRQPWARLLPDYLKPAGYRSYHSGKWHIDGKVLDGGFDRSLNVASPGNHFTARGSSLDDVTVKPPADEKGYYLTIATTDHAIGCLKDHAANHAKTPFFQYIALHAPHFPLHALPEDIAKYRELENACRKPGEWQVFDIRYRAPRRDDAGKITEKGTVTVWFNGKKVQDNTEFGEPKSTFHPFRFGNTPYLDKIRDQQKKTATGPVFLQDHGNPVKFRNVWVLPADDRAFVYEPGEK